MAYRHADRSHSRSRDGLRRRQSVFRTVWPDGVANKLAAETGDYL